MNGVAFVGLVDLVDALTITPLTHPRGMNWQVASRGTRDALQGLQPELVARTGRRFSSRHRLFSEQSSPMWVVWPHRTHFKK
jgi:hypothetical protein